MKHLGMDGIAYVDVEERAGHRHGSNQDAKTELGYAELSDTPALEKDSNVCVVGR